MLRERDIQLGRCVCGSATRLASGSRGGSHKALTPLSPSASLPQIPPLQDMNEEELSLWRQLSPDALLSNDDPIPFTRITDDNVITQALVPMVGESSQSTALTDAVWPANIPPRELLSHLVETVFNAVPLATRVLHRPTFMANLAKPPNDLNFP